MTTPETPWLCPQGDACPCWRAHDTYSAYRRGCRSGKARDDYYRYRKQHRAGAAPERVVDSLGTRRRLQALYALGWPWTKLAEETGLDVTWLGRVAWGRESQQRVSLDRAETVDTAFRRLGMLVGPCPRTRGYATRANFAPPLAWDDIDDPSERPKWGMQRPGVARWDSAKVRLDVERLTRQGCTARVIAEQLGISERSVVRIRAELRDQGAAA